MLMRLITLHQLLDTANAKDRKREDKKKNPPFAPFMAFYLAVHPQRVFLPTREIYTGGVMHIMRLLLGRRR